MTYIYDILLNFNENLIEYFEWNEKDQVKYVKKSLLFKTTSKTIHDIIKNNVMIDKEFTSKIPKYEMNGMKGASSLCLLTDGLIVIGILLRNDQVEGISRLLLDEELEALEISENLKSIEIKYTILSPKKKKNMFLTRKEEVIKEKLENEITNLYKNKKYEKLMYLYYEFTNKESNNTEQIYKYMLDSLNNFSEKHIKLFDILLLSTKNV